MSPYTFCLVASLISGTCFGLSYLFARRYEVSNHAVKIGFLPGGLLTALVAWRFGDPIAQFLGFVGGGGSALTGAIAASVTWSALKGRPLAPRTTPLVLPREPRIERD